MQLIWTRHNKPGIGQNQMEVAGLVETCPVGMCPSVFVAINWFQFIQMIMVDFLLNLAQFHFPESFVIG